MPTKRLLAELHTHSTFSDGQFSPDTLAGLLEEAGVSLWSLTDHDTCRGAEEAQAAASARGIEFIPGIEISAWHGRSIHVLGYGVDPEAIQAYEDRRLNLREERMHAMVERLAELGVPITWDQVMAAAGDAVSLARPHLARALVNAGHVVSVQQAFDLYLAEGRPAYRETDWPLVPRAIEIIHDAGGIAVLAHPGQYAETASRERIVEWVELGLDGIECNHPRHDESHSAYYAALADELRILKTASTDYHSPDRYGVLGSVALDHSWYDALKNAIREKNLRRTRER